jgi:hypothetical protein
MLLKKSFTFGTLKQSCLRTVYLTKHLIFHEEVEIRTMAATKKGKTESGNPSTPIHVDNMDKGFKMLKQQYAEKFSLPVNDDIWEKRGMFSQTILEKLLDKDKK